MRDYIERYRRLWYYDPIFMTYPVKFEIELKKNLNAGLYIALEGIDGSGKTTQARELQKHFESLGMTVFLTHEPRRDGVIGPLIHDVLQADVAIPEVAIQYLFAAQRVVHLEEMVIPALQRGEVVISDRCFWSSIPYGLLDRFESSNETAERLLATLSVLSMYHEFITPDMALFLDVDVETAGKRIAAIKRKVEIYEKKDKLQRVRNGYEFLLNKFPDQLVRIHAERHIDEVTKEIVEMLRKVKK